jgi:uncharacterized protein (DUF983 family)
MESKEEPIYYVAGFRSLVPGSKKVSCSECGHDCFVAPSGHVPAMLMPIICVGCFFKKVQEEDN